MCAYSRRPISAHPAGGAAARRSSRESPRTPLAHPVTSARASAAAASASADPEASPPPLLLWPPLRPPLLPGVHHAYVDSALNDGKLHLRCPGAAGSGLCRELDMNHVKVFASPGVLGERVEQLRRQHGARLSDSLKDPTFAAFCAEHARKCPLCHVVIFRHAGCDHMVCKCGHVWNWKDKEAVVAN